MNRRSTEFKAEVIHSLKTTGLSIRDVAEAYEVSTGSVCKWMREAGMPRTKGIAAPPACHPERPFYSKGKCRPCYTRDWEAGRAA